MKTYKINEDQVRLIKNALQYVYDSKLDNIKQSRKIMTDLEIEENLELAKKYFDIQDIFEKKYNSKITF